MNKTGWVSQFTTETVKKHYTCYSTHIFQEMKIVTCQSAPVLAVQATALHREDETLGSVRKMIGSITALTEEVLPSSRPSLLSINEAVV